jgi:hypothetical protein
MLWMGIGYQMMRFLDYRYLHPVSSCEFSLWLHLWYEVFIRKSKWKDLNK